MGCWLCRSLRTCCVALILAAVSIAVGQGSAAAESVSFPCVLTPVRGPAVSDQDQRFTVPAGINSATFEVNGAQGGPAGRFGEDAREFRRGTGRTRHGVVCGHAR
jgi:hypothetical protein